MALPEKPKLRREEVLAAADEAWIEGNLYTAHKYYHSYIREGYKGEEIPSRVYARWGAHAYEYNPKLAAEYFQEAVRVAISPEEHLEVDGLLDWAERRAQGQTTEKPYEYVRRFTEERQELGVTAVEPEVEIAA